VFGFILLHDEDDVPLVAVVTLARVRLLAQSVATLSSYTGFLVGVPDVELILATASTVESALTLSDIEETNGFLEGFPGVEHVDEATEDDQEFTAVTTVLGGK
jgi:hypothetical protein